MTPRTEICADAARVPKESTGLGTKVLRMHSLPVLFVLLLTFFLYARTLSYQFVYDDKFQVLHNPHLLSWAYLPNYFKQNVWGQDPNLKTNFYRPLFLVWLRSNMAVFGTESVGWHLATVLMHVLVTGLIYLVAYRLLNQRLAALVAAAVFGFHPIHVESVAWISGVNEPIGAAFFLLAFLCYLKQRTSPVMASVWLVLSLTFFGAAVLAKETEVVLPLLVVVYEWTVGRSSQRRGWGIRLIPYAAILCVYFVLRAFALHTVVGPTGNPRDAMSVPWLILSYVKILVWPARLSMMYDFTLVDHAISPRFFIGLGVIIVFCWLVWWFRKRGWELGNFLLGWFALTLAPALAGFCLAFTLDGYYHDRYLYLPSFALAGALGLAVRFFYLRRPLALRTAAWVGTTVLLAAFAFLTLRQEATWQNDDALFSHALQVAPQNLVAFHGYTLELSNRGEYVRALALAEAMMKTHPEAYSPFWSAGAFAFELHDFALAERYYVKAIELHPAASDHRVAAYLRLFLAMSRIKLGRYDAAEAPLRSALSFDSATPNLHCALGMVLTHLGRWTEARDEFAAELQAHSESTQAHDGLAEVEAHLQSQAVHTMDSRRAGLSPRN